MEEWKRYIQAWLDGEDIPAVFGHDRERTVITICHLLNSIEPTETDRTYNALVAPNWRVIAYDYGIQYLKSHYNTVLTKE